jgi:hypothetical protein
MCKKDGKELWLKINDDEYYEEYDTKEELEADLNGIDWGPHDSLDEYLDAIRVLHVVVKQEYHPIALKAPIKLEPTT